MIFSVWAPEAKSVDLVLGELRVALQRLDQGYWQTDVAEPNLAQGYRYSVNGGSAVPDPRSRWQPHGVHGASFIATGPFAESRQDFRAVPLSRAIIYELHIGTFTEEGTYAAALKKLPHLIELGVTHLELMPLATFPGTRGWGYDGVDLFAPFPAYGTPSELHAFVQACHSHGLAVLLDVVYNHLGPDGNYLGHFAPYFTDRYRTGWGAAINYDGPQSDEVRRFVVDNATMWLREYSFDGLRLDAVHAIFSFEAVHLLEELSAAVKNLGEELGRSFVLIAESDLNDPRLVRQPTHGGYGLDAQWVDDFHHALHRFFTNERDGYYADFAGLQDVATALRDGYVYQGQYSAHRGHRHGRAPACVAAHQMIVSAQNHDQIGNRAQGDRMSMMLQMHQVKAVAALTLLSPFVPLLFQGEEWAARTPFLYFTDHENPELGRLVAEGRSREFSSFSWQGTVPNPQDQQTFLRSKLNWSELREPAHAEVLEWYRSLIRLRRGKPVLPRGSAEGDFEGPQHRDKAETRFDPQQQWLTYVHNGVLAVFNFSDHVQSVPMPDGAWSLALHSDNSTSAPQDGAPARSTLIYVRRDEAT